VSAVADPPQPPERLWWGRFVLVLAPGGRAWLQRGLRQAVRRLGELAHEAR
jgi:hypothetical protein